MSFKMIPVRVDGTEFEVTWHDYGSFTKLRVYQNGKALGFKDFPLTTDQGQGIIEYSVRSLLKGNKNGLTQETTKA